MMPPKELNNEIAWMVCDYLGDHPRAITKELMRQVDPDGTVPVERLYAALLAGFCGAERDEQMWYFNQMVRRCEVTEYQDNPYFKYVCFPQLKLGRWEITRDSYAPYEAFPCVDIKVFADGREVPQLGFFEEPFSFPVIKEDGREWMALKPNEVETMKDAIAKVRGSVTVFGLGLGYFTYMAARKENVSEVKVIEKSPEAIAIFTQFLLPQFPFEDKITIIEADAFDYLESGDMSSDYAFVDLWHDSGDGPELYLKAKSYENRHPRTRFLYWIEDSLKSALRWKASREDMVFISRYCSILDLQT